MVKQVSNTDSFPTSVWIVERVEYGRDGQYDTEIRDFEEGFFYSEKTAHSLLETLNKHILEKYEASENARKKSHAAEVRRVARKNRENDALRAAGMKKKHYDEPDAFEEQSFDDFLSALQEKCGYVIYEVVEITQSEEGSSIQESR